MAFQTDLKMQICLIKRPQGFQDKEADFRIDLKSRTISQKNFFAKCSDFAQLLIQTERQYKLSLG